VLKVCLPTGFDLQAAAALSFAHVVLVQ
jgi:hypothetical protein